MLNIPNYFQLLALLCTFLEDYPADFKKQFQAGNKEDFILQNIYKPDSSFKSTEYF